MVRAQVAATTDHEAVDLLVDRLRQRLVRLAQRWEAMRGRRPSAEPHEWRHGAGIKQGPRWNAGREGTPVLTVVTNGEDAPADHVDGGSLIDVIVRDGARRMLAAALEAEVAAVGRAEVVRCSVDLAAGRSGAGCDGHGSRTPGRWRWRMRWAGGCGSSGLLVRMNDRSGAVDAGTGLYLGRDGHRSCCG
jgi:hypothetical protein